MTDLLLQAEALKRLLASLPLDAGTREVGEQALACAIALNQQGEANCASELLDAAAIVRPGLGGDYGARLAVARAQCRYLMEEYEECAVHCSQAIVDVINSAPGSIASLHALRAYEGAALFRLHRIEEARSKLDSLRSELLRFPDSATHSMVSLNLSGVSFVSGAVEHAVAQAIEALVAARRAQSLYWEAAALSELASLHKHSGQWQAAEEAARSAVLKFGQLGNEYWQAQVGLLLAIVLKKRGRLTGALDACDSQGVHAKKVGSELLSSYGDELRAQIMLELGQPEAARKVLEDLVERRRGKSPERVDILAIEFLGDAQLETAEHAQALADYDRALDLALAIAPRGDIVAELRRRRAECFLLLGKHERARHEAEEAIAHCTEISDRYEEAATYRILALALGALGRHDEARSTFDRGFAAYEDIETPYEWGKLWMSYADWICGEHAGAYRDMNGAHEAYRNAATYFENIGAAGKLEEARKRLTALEAMMQREGAVVDFEGAAKPKPLRRPREIADLRRRGQWIYEQFGMVTRSKIMIDMLEEVARVAASDLPVLILGESGTGKELVAQGVHKLSGRRGRFVPINASALPDTLVEGELFGHTQGAFTNAVRDREGLFEFSNNGTIFLDEIGEMSVDLQAKLLRVLELGEIRRVGGTASVLVDARVVAATNRDRAQMEAGEGFRADLYYRLSHAMFEIPPLRQRGEDVEFLVEHFLDKFCGMYNKRVTISPEAMHRLVSNPWPGNVRQLAATMQRLIVSARTVHTLMPREVPAPSRATPTTAPASLEEELLHKERQRIIEALEKSQWVKADAARLLRMSRTTLITKMKRMHIEG